MDRWDDIAARAADGLTRFKARHGKGVMAAAAAALGGFGVLAFAVAPMAPDAARLPLSVVSEDVATLDVAPQLEALAGHTLDLSFSEVLRGGAALDTVLRRPGVVFSTHSPTSSKMRGSILVVGGRGKKTNNKTQ